MRKWVGLAALSLAVATGGAIAKDQKKPSQKAAAAAPMFDDLIACRTATDDAARLACYDRTVSVVQAAYAGRQLVVLDQEGVRRAKRSIFGFSIPRFKLFGGSGADEPEVLEIEGKLTAVRALPYDHYSFALDDGSVWQTTDPEPYETPKVGQMLKIRAGAVGSYFARYASGRGTKVKRVR